MKPSCWFQQELEHIERQDGADARFVLRLLAIIENARRDGFDYDAQRCLVLEVLRNGVGS